mmetsp:Transcript_3630/g.10954  ORF Transcript_3630/g.10954 Transcript_3630/m.10954 type:complete len:363 (+) Transcript_3630:265-1353(+)
MPRHPHPHSHPLLGRVVPRRALIVPRRRGPPHPHPHRHSHSHPWSRGGATVHGRPRRPEEGTALRRHGRPAPRPIALGARNPNLEPSVLDLEAVQVLDRGLGGLLVCKLDKPKPTRLARVPVGDDPCLDDGTVGLEQGSQIGLPHAPGDEAHVEVGLVDLPAFVPAAVPSPSSARGAQARPSQARPPAAKRSEVGVVRPASPGRGRRLSSADLVQEVLVLRVELARVLPSKPGHVSLVLLICRLLHLVWQLVDVCGVLLVTAHLPVLVRPQRSVEFRQLPELHALVLVLGIVCRDEELLHHLTGPVKTLLVVTRHHHVEFLVLEVRWGTRPTLLDATLSPERDLGARLPLHTLLRVSPRADD